MTGIDKPDTTPLIDYANDVSLLHLKTNTYSPLRLRPRRICDIYDLFAPHINVLTYLLTYLWQI